MFEHDRSAARGLMTTRALVIFEHASLLGDARAQSLFDRVKAKKVGGVPRSFDDYEVTLDGRRVQGGRTIVHLEAPTVAHA
jgi:CRISPR-associated protein Csd2